MIKPLQEDLGGLKRVTYDDGEKIKQRIIEAKKKGLSATEIANECNISIPRIYQVLKAEKL